MSLTRTFSLTYGRRRTFITSLFALTFLASVVTVSASAVLPCPATNNRFADGDSEGKAHERRIAIVEKRPRRWIEEKPPTPRA